MPLKTIRPSDVTPLTRPLAVFIGAAKLADMKAAQTTAPMTVDNSLIPFNFLFLCNALHL
jgi:hypothetical protein